MGWLQVCLGFQVFLGCQVWLVWLVPKPEVCQDCQDCQAYQALVALLQGAWQGWVGFQACQSCLVFQDLEGLYQVDCRDCQNSRVLTLQKPAAFQSFQACLI